MQTSDESWFGMANNIEYYNLHELLRGKAIDVIASFALFIFMIAEPIQYVFRVVLPSDLQSLRIDRWFINLVLVILLIAYYNSVFRSNYKKTTVWFVYGAAYMAIFVGVFLHPEYERWYTHSLYGIKNSFFTLYSGFFALLFFSLISDKKRILGTVVFSEKINFIFYFALFFFATRRGYWGGINGNGNFVKLNYNLTFGYNVARTFVLGMLLYNFDKKKLQGFIICYGSLIMIILAGSRGAFLCVIAGFLLTSSYRLRISTSKTNRTVIYTLLSLGGLSFFAIGRNALLSFISSVALKVGISSRSIEMLISGSLMEGNGRNAIWAMAREMIGQHWLLGYGFYGDRNTIGMYWTYGYPHNIFYELAIEFGVIAAVTVLLLILNECIKFWKHCDELEWRVLFIVSSSSSLKLLVSDSFWYLMPFWAMIAILMRRHQQKRSELRKTNIYPHRFDDGTIRRQL